MKQKKTYKKLYDKKLEVPKDILEELLKLGYDKRTIEMAYTKFKEN